MVVYLEHLPEIFDANTNWQVMSFIFNIWVVWPFYWVHFLNNKDQAIKRESKNFTATIDDNVDDDTDDEKNNDDDDDDGSNDDNDDDFGGGRWW